MTSLYHTSEGKAMRKNTIIIHCVASGKKLKRICGHIHISGIVLRLPSDSEIPHRWISLLAYPVFLPSFPGTDFPGEYPHHGPDSKERRFHHRERQFGPADHSRKHAAHHPEQKDLANRIYLRMPVIHGLRFGYRDVPGSTALEKRFPWQ